jgi:LacI family transcriptional regulator
LKAIKARNRNISIKDIAEKAQVSIGPVDKVLHNRGGVSETTKARILKAIEELNYKPNVLASRLKSNKEYTICVLIPGANVGIPFWSQYIKGFEDAEDELSQFGIYIEIFYFDQNSEESFRAQIDAVFESNCDGIFMVPVFAEQTNRLLGICDERRIPAIFFNTEFPVKGNLSFIGQNSFESGFLAADLLSKCIPESSSILLANLVREADNHMHFQERENGFRSFFEQQTELAGIKVLKYENKSGDDHAIKQDLLKIIGEENVKSIFCTNGTNKVAQIVCEQSMKGLRLIGYDLIDENIDYLNKGVIDFLISQQPYTQAFQGIKLFYQFLILKQPITETQYLPIDIVMKSNLKYYGK